MPGDRGVVQHHHLVEARGRTRGDGARLAPRRARAGCRADRRSRSRCRGRSSCGRECRSTCPLIWARSAQHNRTPAAGGKLSGTGPCSVRRAAHQHVPDTGVRCPMRAIILPAALAGLLVSPRLSRPRSPRRRRTRPSRPQGRDFRQGPGASLGHGVPARRSAAGDRAPRARAHRRQGRQAVGAAAGRAQGLRQRTGRACSTCSSDPISPPPALVYLSYAEPRDGSSNGTSVARGKLVAEGEGGRLDEVQGDLPAGAVVCLEQPLRLAHRLHARRLPVRDAGRPLLGPRRGAEPRQPPGQAGAHHARRQPLRRQSRRKPGWRPEIWSIGHRNVQGAALHPADRQAVDHRARRARRRRDQRARGRQELRLAGHHLRARLLAS